MLNVLFLDDFRNPIDVFPLSFCRENHFTICRTMREAWNAVKKGQRYDIWTLDHDMTRTMQREGEDRLYPFSGYDFLIQVVLDFPLVFWPTNAVFVHSANPWGAKRMREIITKINTTQTSPLSGTFQPTS